MTYIMYLDNNGRDRTISTGTKNVDRVIELLRSLNYKTLSIFAG
jgi:hypothetical protein